MKFILITLVSLMVLSEAKASMGPNVSCISAGGYYGAFSLKSECEGSATQLYFRSGLGLNPDKLLRSLKIISGPDYAADISAELPHSGCASNLQNAFEASCNIKNVKIKIHRFGQGDSEVVLDELKITAKRILNTENGRGVPAVNFTVEATKSMEGETLKASTSQVFNIKGPMDTCKVN